MRKTREISEQESQNIKLESFTSESHQILSESERKFYEKQQNRASVVVTSDGVLRRVLSGTGPWTPSEDMRLRSLIRAYRQQFPNNSKMNKEIGGQWGWISRRMGSTLYASHPLGCSKRNRIQCQHRWQLVLRPGLVKGRWTVDEDDLLWQIVNKYTAHKKDNCDKAANILCRTSKRCRERFINHLDPSIVKGTCMFSISNFDVFFIVNFVPNKCFLKIFSKNTWTMKEDDIIFGMQRKIGNKWTEIARALRGRTTNSVKNRFYSSARLRHQEEQRNNLEKNGDTFLVNDKEWFGMFQ
eukprot:GSMAST32.ASY1.ANO1.1432.1 assembled CDS